MPVNTEANVTVVKEQKRPLILAISTITVVLLVIVGIIVYFTLNEYNAKPILITFVVMVIVIGVAMIVYTEIQRRKAIERKNGAAQTWIKSTVEIQTRKPRNSTPSSMPPQRASWALIPRKWSTGTVLPAYSPAQPSAPTIHE